MRKIIKLSALVMIGVVISFPIRSFLVYADNNSRDHQEIQNKDGKEHGDNNDQKDDEKNENSQSNNDGQNEDGQSNDEHDIFSLIVADSQKTPALTLPEINEKLILTYADVVNVIKSYEKAVSQISANVGVDTQTANLTAGEKLLLNGLLNKHRSQFNRLNNRIIEINTQLKQLEDLLSPLGAQPISSMYGIRGLLISELNNYRDIISGISEFDDLNLQTLQGETD